ncbi:MAG: hypothetical protein HQL29_06430 [Candidatus Omnitrophica bacterium]|nr:hypothetical protein [Candidatus Omnitrophota bacterium]
MYLKKKSTIWGVQDLALAVVLVVVEKAVPAAAKVVALVHAIQLLNRYIDSRVGWVVFFCNPTLWVINTINAYMR